MSNVISFLESVGQDATLRHASQDELELALTTAQIEPALQKAILGKDQTQIEAQARRLIDVIRNTLG